MRSQTSACQGRLDLVTQEEIEGEFGSGFLLQQQIVVLLGWDVVETERCPI